MIRSGADTLDSVIAGVNIIELDPNDTSVGYGGLPNEEAWWSLIPRHARTDEKGRIRRGDSRY